MTMELFDITSFRLMPPPTRSISLSELRIAPAKFIFSPTSAAELGYPRHICFLYSDENKQLLVIPSHESEFSVPFITEENPTIPLKSIAIGHSALVKALRTDMQWASKGTYRIQGGKVPDSSYLIFDLTTATSGKRELKKLTPEEFLRSCPKAQDLIMSPSFVPLHALPPAKVMKIM